LFKAQNDHDDRDRDTRCDQAVFDGRRRIFVAEKSPDGAGDTQLRIPKFFAVQSIRGP
jgi:hypothetical protein